MAWEDGSLNDYLVLHPGEAGAHDLLRIFYSSELEKRDFFDTPVEDRLDSARGRWLIFVSVVAQKVLLRLRKPLAAIGSAVETFLNYPTSNGGYGRLFLNLLTGKTVTPDSSSATFRSFIGYLDTRVDLDRKIRVNDNRYKAALAIMGSKMSYENEAFACTVVRDHWQMEFLGLFNFWNEYEQKYSTQAIMFQNKRVEPDLIVLAFRGTSPFSADDWITDFDMSWYDIKGVGRLHAGFQHALGLQKDKGWPKDIGSSPRLFAYYTLREKLRSLLGQNQKAKVMVTGHSLGGALAILFVAILSLHEEEGILDRMEGVYTFGQPRVGDGTFGEFMKEKLRIYDIKYLRHVYCNDIVPRLPFDDKAIMFKHFGPCLYFNSLYQAQVLEEEPNKNYFSLVWYLPMVLNAVFELMRSFIIPFVRGMEYREGLTVILFRMIGLVIPGVSDHGPQDYVNMTRLVSLPKSAELARLETRMISTSPRMGNGIIPLFICNL